jgi:hypothetical protein
MGLAATRQRSASEKRSRIVGGRILLRELHGQC